MSQETETTPRRRRQRTVTRRIRDKEGNIITKKYTKKQTSFLGDIQINWMRVPSVLIGLAFGFYAYAAYLYNNDNLDQLGGLGDGFGSFFEPITGVTALFVTGTIAVYLAVALGWALVTAGFNVKKWNASWRKLIAIVAGFLLFSAIFSAFINERGIVRQQADQVNASDNYDISSLTAPFYSELLDGLMDLIGNIPNPQETVAVITPGGGQQFDANKDTYLWRWLIAETYDTQKEDFVKGYESYKHTLPAPNPTSFATGDESRPFRVSQQYLTLGNSYSGEVVAPYNSIQDTLVNLNNVQAEVANSETAELTDSQGYYNINQQSVLQAAFSESRTSGYIDYDTYWVEELKQNISQNSWDYSRLLNAVNQKQVPYDKNRFGDLSQAGSFSKIWGEKSLPGGADYKTDDADFLTAYNRFQSNLGDNASVYQYVTAISNKVQQEVIGLFQDDAAGIDPTNPDVNANSPPKGSGIDKGHYFWSQVENGGAFGIKDALTGFTNMIRAFNIPARPIIGFSLGDIQPNQITLTFEYVHLWVEALIPWIDSNNNTQLSWGMFNPIPDFHKLSEGKLEFGRNTLGTAPQVQIDLSGGEKTNFPSGTPDVEGQSVFTLGSVGEPINVSGRVLSEGNPGTGQTIDFRLVTENEFNNFDPTSGFDIGTSLGEVTTDQDGFANFSILVESNDNTTITWANGTSRDLGVNIDTLNLLDEANRNVYAIVGIYSISYNFSLVAWTLEANINIDLDIGTYSFLDPGLPDQGDAEIAYAYPDETVRITATLTNNEGQPLGGYDGLEVSLQDAADISLIQDQLTSGIIPSGIQMGPTNSTGQVDYDMTIQASDVIVGQYYSIFVVYTGLFIFDNVLVHITDEFDLTLTQENYDDRAIFRDELDVWNLSFSSQVSDSYLEGVNSTVSARPASGIDVEYFLFNQAQYESLYGTPQNIIDNYLENAGNCPFNDFTGSFDCYQLADVGTSNQMGYDGPSTTLANGSINVDIKLEGNTVPYDTYYIVVYAPSTGLFFNTTFFGFTSLLQPFYGIDAQDTNLLRIPHPHSLNSGNLDMKFLFADCIRDMNSVLIMKEASI